MVDFFTFFLGVCAGAGITTALWLYVIFRIEKQRVAQMQEETKAIAFAAVDEVFGQEGCADDTDPEERGN